MTGATSQGERPRAIELLEKAWPHLDKTHKIKLDAIAEVLALMSERQQQAATA